MATDHQDEISRLVSLSYDRAEAKLYAELGRQPESQEIAFLVLQSQIFMLACSLFDEDERIEWLKNSLTVIGGGKPPGMVS